MVKIPAKPSSSSRRPHYITSSVSGIDFTVTPGNYYVFYTLMPQATYCSSGPSGLTCTLNVPSPPGSDTFAVNLYDNTEPGLSYVVSTGKVTQTISPQASNVINVITDAIPTFVTLGISSPYPTAAVAAAVPLTLNISDPDGNIIIGSFGEPIAMATTDTTGAITFSKTALNQSSDATGLTLNYNGAPIGVSYASAVPTSTGNSLAIPPPSSGGMPFQPGFAGPVAAPALLYFAHATSAAQTVTITGANGSTAPFTLSTTAAPYGSCGGYATVSGSSPTFTVTPNAATFATPSYNSIGNCYLTATDSNAAVLPVPVMISP